MASRAVTFFLLTWSGLLISCGKDQSDARMEQNPMQSPKEKIVIPGKDEPLDSVLISQGQVLISYSDCYQCHKIVGEAKGPSFQEIAERYPHNYAILDMLGRKIISGGAGTWGYPVMSGHPELSPESAKAMVTFVLAQDPKRQSRKF